MGERDDLHMSEIVFGLWGLLRASGTGSAGPVRIERDWVEGVAMVLILMALILSRQFHLTIGEDFCFEVSWCAVCTIRNYGAGGGGE